MLGQWSKQSFGMLVLGWMLCACSGQADQPRADYTAIPSIALSSVSPRADASFVVTYDAGEDLVMVWAQNEGVRRLDFVKGGDTRGGSFSVEGDLRDNNAGERRAQSCIWSEIIDDADRAFVSCDEGGRTGAPFDALINGLGGTSGNVREGPEILGEATVCYSLSGNLFGSGEVCVGKESALMLSFSSSSNQRGNLNQNLIARCLTADAPDLVLTPLSSRFEDVLPVARLDLPPLDCR